MSGYYTDLAMESGRLGAGAEVPGVSVARQERDGVSCVRVDVLSEEGERETGKHPGTYTTLYTDSLTMDDGSAADALRNMLADELRQMAALDDDARGSVLVLGLGNRQVTPDAIGPRAADMVLSTRALMDGAGMSGLRRVMTAAPGVYGMTGIEVSELVRGLVKELSPDLIIAVDALCAREPGRIACTVQLSNSGIQPGSGVGNHRAELSYASLGVKVIAVGVPTVVYASTIVADALERLGMRGGAGLACAPGSGMEGMIVTPREIDSLVEHASRLIAGAINQALQPGLTQQELMWLTI